MADGDSPQQAPLPILDPNNHPKALLTRPSYSAALQSKEQDESLPHPSKIEANSEVVPLKPILQFQGKKAVFFTSVDKSELVERLQYVLIGKFSHGRPSWAKIKEFFVDLKLIGAYNISVFDQKHIYIECSNQIDYNHVWLKLQWLVDGCAMRLLKWVPQFSPVIESPIVPVWIRMDGIPLYMFEEMPIWQIANVIGKPMKIDARNLNRAMLNIARVCVELDISEPLIDSFWVCFEEKESGVVKDKFCVHVFYDFVPSYCSVCFHVGHRMEQCKSKQPCREYDDTNQLKAQVRKTSVHNQWIVKSKTAAVLNAIPVDKGKGMMYAEAAPTRNETKGASLSMMNSDIALRIDATQVAHSDQVEQIMPHHSNDNKRQSSFDIVQRLSKDNKLEGGLTEDVLIGENTSSKRQISELEMAATHTTEQPIAQHIAVRELCAIAPGREQPADSTGATLPSACGGEQTAELLQPSDGLLQPSAGPLLQPSAADAPGLGNCAGSALEFPAAAAQGRLEAECTAHAATKSPVQQEEAAQLVPTPQLYLPQGSHKEQSTIMSNVATVNEVQQSSTKAEQQESRSEAELPPKSATEDEWHVVVSKNKRSREKASATASAPKNISNRLVFDHNIQDVRSGHSEPRQIKLLRPSWADQVEEECESPTLQQTVSNTTEDTGEIDSDLRAFIKAHFLESSATIEAALRKRQSRQQQITPEDSTLGTGIEQVEKGHAFATKESKEDKPRQVHFHDLVTMHIFEKEANRRSERRAPKNTSHTEKDFKLRVLEDQHHEGWPLKELQGKHAHTPGTKAKSNDPG